MDEPNPSVASTSTAYAATPAEPSMALWPNWARAYSPAGKRVTFALISLGVVFGALALTAWTDLIALAILVSAGDLVTENQFSLITQIQAILALVWLGGFISAVIAFCMWMHRAYRNLPGVGAEDLKFSPRQAVAWWFVPLVNLWQPYRIVREIWQRSGPAGVGSRLLVAWWTLWLLANYGTRVISGLHLDGWLYDVGDVISTAIGALATVYAVLVIRRIQFWQEQRAAALNAAPTERPVSERRTRVSFLQVPRAVALLLIVILLTGSTVAVYAQGSYPGGLAGWYTDLSGPARLSDYQLQNEVRRALVTVVAKTWQSDTVDQGSAFFFGNTHDLVTAAHIVPDHVASLTIVDGHGKEWPTQLVGLNRDLDLAMLRVSGSNPLPLQPAGHPVDVRSAVFMAGNPGGDSPGTILKGLIADTDFSSQTDTTSLKHAYEILGGPIRSGMSGGPVLDAWGRVIGVVSASTEDGHDSVAVPIKQFLDQTTASVWPLASPLPVGPPLITTPASELVLSPEAMAGRSATQNQNSISYTEGSRASDDFDHGVLVVEVYPTITTATDRLTQEKSKMLAKLSGASVQQVALGDGGVQVTFTDQRSGYEFTGLIWTDRNALAVWWIETIGWDESRLFTYISKQQEEVLATAS